jgi:hypothetical protein
MRQTRFTPVKSSEFNSIERVKNFTFTLTIIKTSYGS